MFTGGFLLGVVCGIAITIIFFSDPDRFPGEGE